MCTLSWLDRTDGYQLFCNRDERHARLPASAPAVRRRGQTRYIAPLDGNCAGTWLAVNEFGLSLCLLNGPEAPPQQRAHDATDCASSRGHLVLDLIEASSARLAAQRLESMTLARFRPFLLAVLDPAGPALRASWCDSRLQLSHGVLPNPLISSSFDTDEVRSNRTRVFQRLQRAERWKDPVQLHRAFHESHEPVAGPLSTCMHRDEAGTVSFSWIEVERRLARFHYVPHPPCQGLPSHAPMVLERRAAPDSVFRE